LVLKRGKEMAYLKGMVQVKFTMVCVLFYRKEEKRAPPKKKKLEGDEIKVHQA